jgi:hypothetical protein
MSNERKRQQKLLAHRKKRELVKKKERQSLLGKPTSEDGLVRKAAQCPFGPAYVSHNWRDTDPDKGLVTVLLTRRLPNGLLLLAVALVDRVCLGIKNGYTKEPMDEYGLREYLERMEEAHGGEPEECSVLTAQSIVFHGIDYARSLGFSPHRDFPALLFGPRPELLLDTPLAKPQKPYYVSGPRDNVPQIMAQLQSKIGAGNFDFLAHIGSSSSFVDDEGLLEDNNEDEPAK